MLAYYLYFKNKSLVLWSGFKTNLILKNLKKLFLIKLGIDKGAEIINLPIYGNICLSIHQGYKIFNFKKGSVIKIFDRNLPADIVATEIKGVREAGHLDFSPDIVDWNMKDRWFEEELVEGSMGYAILNSNPNALMSVFRREIIPLLENMILLKKPVYTLLCERVDSCLSIINKGNRLSAPGLDAQKVNSIKKGIGKITESLRKEDNQKICLIFSHGDFSFKNVMITKKRTMVIDWEGVAFRSVLFDLYNWFFTELYYHNGSSNLVPEISEAISIFKKHLNDKAPDIVQSLSSMASAYRFLFYLERMTMLLQRNLSDKLLDITLSSYMVFMEYEDNQSHHFDGC